MRRLLIPIIAVILACNVQPVLAQEKSETVAPRQEQKQQVQTRRTRRSSRRSRTSSMRKFFGDVMELERRKNAWLKKTFLRR